jgi:hypothetical protein
VSAAIRGRGFGCDSSALAPGVAEASPPAAAAPAAKVAIASRRFKSVFVPRRLIVMKATSIAKRLFERCITLAAGGVQERPAG